MLGGTGCPIESVPGRGHATFALAKSPATSQYTCSRTMGEPAHTHTRTHPCARSRRQLSRHRRQPRRHRGWKGARPARSPRPAAAMARQFKVKQAPASPGPTAPPPAAPSHFRFFIRPAFASSVLRPSRCPLSCCCCRPETRPEPHASLAVKFRAKTS